MFYAAVVSLPLLQSQKFFGMTKDSLVKKLKMSTENAFSAADIISRLDIKICQAFVAYLTSQFLSEVSRSHSIYIGAVVWHFQIAGFDPDSLLDSDIDRQTKCHLWQHSSFSAFAQQKPWDLNVH